jgi:hypothetical protein
VNASRHFVYAASDAGPSGKATGAFSLRHTTGYTTKAKQNANIILPPAQKPQKPPTKPPTNTSIH